MRTALATLSVVVFFLALGLFALIVQVQILQNRIPVEQTYTPHDWEKLLDNSSR